MFKTIALFCFIVFNVVNCSNITFSFVDRFSLADGGLLFLNEQFGEFQTTPITAGSLYIEKPNLRNPILKSMQKNSTGQIVSIIVHQVVNAGATIIPLNVPISPVQGDEEGYRLPAQVGNYVVNIAGEQYALFSETDLKASSTPSDFVTYALYSYHFATQKKRLLAKSDANNVIFAATSFFDEKTHSLLFYSQAGVSSSQVNLMQVDVLGQSKPRVLFQDPKPIFLYEEWFGKSFEYLPRLIDDVPAQHFNLLIPGKGIPRALLVDTVTGKHEIRTLPQSPSGLYIGKFNHQNSAWAFISGISSPLGINLKFGVTKPANSYVVLPSTYAFSKQYGPFIIDDPGTGKFLQVYHVQDKEIQETTLTFDVVGQGDMTNFKMSLDEKSLIVATTIEDWPNNVFTSTLWKVPIDFTKKTNVAVKLDECKFDFILRGVEIPLSLESKWMNSDPFTTAGDAYRIDTNDGVVFWAPPNPNLQVRQVPLDGSSPAVAMPTLSTSTHQTLPKTFIVRHPDSGRYFGYDINNKFFEMPGKLDMQHTFPLKMETLPLTGNGDKNQMVPVNTPSSGTGNSLYLINAQAPGAFYLTLFEAQRAQFNVILAKFDMASVERVPMCGSRVVFVDSNMQNVWSVNATGGDLKNNFQAPFGIFSYSKTQVPMLVDGNVLTFALRNSQSSPKDAILVAGEC